MSSMALVAENGRIGGFLLLTMRLSKLNIPEFWLYPQ